VSERLKPYHVARVEKAYKDQFSATIKLHLNVVARAIGMEQETSDKVLFFEGAVRPVLARVSELALDRLADKSKLQSLKTTIEQQLASQGVGVDLSDLEPESIEDRVTARFMSTLPSSQAENIENVA
jgi:hypothetical protein